MNVLVFEVSGRNYGLEAENVIEILPSVSLTPLPGSPSVIEGIFNLRGTIVSVLDIRVRFALPAKAVEHTDHLIVGSAGPRLVAIRADRAVGLSSLEISRPEGGDGASGLGEQLSGVATVPDGLLLVLNLQTFLSQAESAQLESAVAGTREVPGLVG